MTKDKVHYRELLSWWQRIVAIDPKDLAIIVNKPLSTDRRADSAWRTACAKYAVDTSATGLTEDRSTYQLVRRQQARIIELEARLKEAEERLRVIQSANALERMTSLIQQHRDKHKK